MKIIICGDREWTNEEVIENFIKTLPKDTVVIHGDCRGADKIAGDIAKEKYGLEVIPVPAKWERYYRAAGPIRNRKMLNMNPDKVIAFHNDLTKSTGTIDMVSIARKAGVETIVIGEK